MGLEKGEEEDKTRKAVLAGLLASRFDSPEWG